MSDDRDSILKRRKRFIQAALLGAALSTPACSAEACLQCGPNGEGCGYDEDIDVTPRRDTADDADSSDVADSDTEGDTSADGDAVSDGDSEGDASPDADATTD